MQDRLFTFHSEASIAPGFPANLPPRFRCRTPSDEPHASRYSSFSRYRPARALSERIVSRPAPEFSILVSDDGSGAEEVNRLNALIKANQLSAPHTGPNLLDPLLHTPNTGKGGAVMRGWDCGGGFSFLAFADADGAVNAGEIMRASRYLQSEHGGQDALFGSRVKMLGRSIQRTLIRHITGRVFATLVSLVSGLSSYDTQCGLKILTQPAFQRSDLSCDVKASPSM